GSAVGSTATATNGTSSGGGGSGWRRCRCRCRRRGRGRQWACGHSPNDMQQLSSINAAANAVRKERHVALLVRQLVSHLARLRTRNGAGQHGVPRTPTKAEEAMLMGCSEPPPPSVTQTHPHTAGFGAMPSPQAHRPLRPSSTPPISPPRTACSLTIT
ncbi:hypothetical protein Vretifemale_1232, partial [Volvox reticuliferus]